MNCFWKEYKKSSAKKVSRFSILLIILLLAFNVTGKAKNEENDDKYSLLKVNRELESYGFKTQDQWSSDSLQAFLPAYPDTQVPKITKEQDYLIYPYWQGRLYHKYDWKKVKRVGYFAYIINAEDGLQGMLHSWKVNNVVDFAEKDKTKVDLVLFCNSKSSTTAFLDSDKATENCIDNSYDLITQRENSSGSLVNGDGINVYFPFFDFKQKRKFTDFIRALSLKLKGSKTPLDLIVTFPVSDTVHFDYLTELKPFINELYFADYDYWGVGNIANGWVEKYKKFSGEKSSGKKIPTIDEVISDVIDGSKKKEAKEEDQGISKIFTAEGDSVPTIDDVNSNSLINIDRGMQAFGFRSEKEWDQIASKFIWPYYPEGDIPGKKGNIDYMIYPYWQGQSYLDKKYHFENIRRIGYLGYMINPDNGDPNLTYSWTLPNIAEKVKKDSTKIDLVLYCQGVNETNLFLNSEVARSKCISNAILLSKYRSVYSKGKLGNADGINVFFPYFNFQEKRNFGLFIKKLYMNYSYQNDSVKLIITFPMRDTVQYEYLKSMYMYIDELYFADYDYRGIMRDSALTAYYHDLYLGHKNELNIFQEMIAEIMLAEFKNPFNYTTLEEVLGDWSTYFLAICAMLSVIFIGVILYLFWGKFNQLVNENLSIFILIVALIITEAILLFLFMVELMNYTVLLINVDNPGSYFLLLLPVILIVIFPLTKVIQNQRELP